MDITVDENFVRVGGNSYATNKITSVEIREDPARASGCAVLMIVMALIGLLGSIAFPPFFLVSIPMLILGLLIYRASKKQKYQLFLVTSASEQQALSTGDKALAYDLRNRIEQAMVGAPTL